MGRTASKKKMLEKSDMFSKVLGSRDVAAGCCAAITAAAASATRCLFEGVAVN